MQRSLEHRIARLESAPAFNFGAYLDTLTDEELLAIAGPDCEGVPWAEFTNEEIDALAHGDDSIIESARARYLAKQEGRHLLEG